MEIEDVEEIEAAMAAKAAMAEDTGEATGKAPPL